MQSQSLNGSWQFRQVGSDEWLPGTVPGGVHTDLLALERIPDPFVADNEKRVMWVAETDWEYRHTFTPSRGLLREQVIHLVCEGLDTLADVYFNGQFLGHADNMFRRWEWDVKELLLDGENELRIYFGSPVQFTRGKQAQLPLQGGGDIPGGPHLRKAPCQWGWDWGPKLPPIGVWKDISLRAYSTARFLDVHLRQSHEAGTVSILAVISAESWQDVDLNASLILTSPEGVTTKVENILLQIEGVEEQFTDLELTLKKPELWWPNGNGAQPLYQVEVRLEAGDTLLDQRFYNLGLRTIELRQDPDEWGKTFTFYVNGVPLFAKGSDWIPADSFPTRLTKEYLEGLIRSAAQANMNMLRVWGGGYYPEDMFYDLCDQYGILVWQDFMFACGIYPSDATFFENVHIEAEENVRRLRHHAALALWCGNNEMEQGWVDWGWNKPNDPVNQRLKDGYDRMFHHMLPEIVATEDPDHPYWPSSASSGIAFEKPNDQVQGDCHYWDVWHGRRPFTAYRGQFPRFMSEFGFQALPPFKTIQSYAEPSEWNMTSYVMEHHQRSGNGNSLMIAQMSDTFRMPKDFESLVYLSLVLQAEGIRYGVEHWRRNRRRVSGTLIWQLNDCWPVASWASLDYFGRWKALHYMAKRFYAPVLLSIEETGAKMSVHITSDLTQAWDGVVRWSIQTVAGEILERNEQTVRAQALQDTWVGTYDFNRHFEGDRQRQVVFVCELHQGEALIARTVTPFVANKHLLLNDPGLKAVASVEKDQLVLAVSAQKLARFVELELDGVDAVFSDNYFDIPAGGTVSVTCPLPSGWTAEKAQKAVRMRSLYQSFA
jgi:beta-mannosidase